MPRKYKPKPNTKRYRKHDSNILGKAVHEYRSGEMTLKAIAVKYNIPKSVIYTHSTRTMKKIGGQTTFDEATEEYLIKYINICAEWGYPMNAIDFRYFIKSYLDNSGRTVRKFINNLPGPEYINGFLKRNNDKISQKYCETSRKKVQKLSPEIIKEYFSNLEVSLVGVEPDNILNYDEINLTDDPAWRKILTKRSSKYPERIMNHSRAFISLMVAATATGILLPLYVVYKAQDLYDTWVKNGPPNTRFNRSQTGWIDSLIFEDWIKTIVLPYFRNKQGKKCLIGSHLSSFLTIDLIKLCRRENITFVFWPASSSHLTQPIEVALFKPMKNAWRNILLRWKTTDGKTEAVVSKECFPQLLGYLYESISENFEINILEGFKETGIRPFNLYQVLNRLREDIGTKEEAMEKSVLDILNEMKYYETMDEDLEFGCKEESDDLLVFLVE